MLPAPHEVAAALWDNARPARGTTSPSPPRRWCWASRWRCVAGFALAVAIHLSPLLRRAVYPLAVGSQAVPIPVIGVLLVFWWGFGIFPKLVVIALICFFPVLVTTVDGLAAVDPEQLKLLRTLDASRWQAFRFAELPAALPAALSGARIALAVGVIGAFIAETTTPTTGAYPGLGREIMTDVKLPDRRARTRAPSSCSPSRSPASTRSRSPSAGSRRGASDPIARRRHVSSVATPTPHRGIADRAGGARRLRRRALGLRRQAGRPRRPRASKRFTVMLDFFPNADHAALYSAIAHGDFRAVGLDVDPRRPPTPPNR